MGFIKHSFILAAVLLTGCVSYSQHELPDVKTWPPAAATTASKPTAFVRTTAQNQVNSGPAVAASGAQVTAWESSVTETFRDSGRFARVSTDKVESDIYAEATLRNNEQFSMASAIITGATFFVIPSTARNTFTLETVFKDKDGKELGRVQKSESVRTWMQLVLIFGIPFQQDTRDIVQALTRSTLDEAVQRRLL
jgi:PBP1b-binding outer membrane lipoprotein LpoB